MDINCENCKNFKGYTGAIAKEYRCAYRNEKMGWDLSVCPHHICSEYKPRKEQDMDIKEAYKVMQAAWVDLYDVKVGDTVKVVKGMSSNELGCWCTETGNSRKANKIGETLKIQSIAERYISLAVSGDWPFFCLEKIKSKPHTIAFDGQEPVEISDKSYGALKKALK